MRFQRKVTFLILLLELGVVLLLAGLTYPRLYAEQRESLRRAVTGIASTAAFSIDGDLHASIPPRPSSTSLPAYQQLQTRLKQILSANPGVRYVWTMVPGRKPGQTLFVGDVGGGGSKVPGRPYNAAAIPDLWEGFKIPTADRKEVKDPWGVSISGYAPVRNRAGEVVALLGVDVYDRELYRLRQSFVQFLLISLPVVLVLGLLGGAGVGRTIAHPLSRLVGGMKEVEEGNLSQRVEIFTGDEFQEAAAAFNRMTRGLESARAELRAAFLRTIQSLMTALEAKDPYTRGHSVSVVGYATEIAKALAKPAREIDMLERLSLLHDIGKIGVHDATLSKPSALNPEERRSIQQHPSIGAKILSPLDLTSEELELIASHHEREDGAGYPRGLDRSKISDLVAIVSVADAYDAMTSHRPYRHAMPTAQAMAELRRGAGTQFRPEVVEAFAIVLEKKGLLDRKHYS